jgi:hypothetical protein
MPGLLVVGVGSMIATACWVLMWLAAYLGMVGGTAAAVGFLRGALAEPLLLLSLYWGIQVSFHVNISEGCFFFSNGSIEPLVDICC